MLVPRGTVRQMSETAGDRLFKIRLACGDGARKAEPLDAFVVRVERVTGAVYDPSTISLLERMKQKWRLDDVRTFAAVDPMERGEQWLSALNEAPAASEEREPAHIRLAREHGREVAKGSTELPGVKLPEKKTAAGGKRPRKR